MLGAISEAVVGAATIRAYGVEERTAARIDAAVEAHRKAASRRPGPVGRRVLVRAARLRPDAPRSCSSSARCWRRRRSSPSASCSPSSSWSTCSPSRCRWPPRSSTRCRTPSPAGAGSSASSTPRPTSSDPGEDGATLPRGPITVRLRRASASPTPAAPPVLHDVDLHDRAAHPGRDRGRDRLGQVHARQAAHPADGPDRGRGAPRRRRPARRSGSPRCASRVVLVPQEGFLFDGTLLDNIRFGRPGGDRATTSRLALDRARPRRLARRPAARAGDRRSASAASRCRRGSGSSSRWPGPTSPTPTCWSSTRRPPPSTRPPRCGSQRALERLTRGPHLDRHRAPALHGRGRRRGDRRRRAGGSSSAGRTRELVARRGRLRRAARVVGRPAAAADGGPGGHRAGRRRSARQNGAVTSDATPALDPAIAARLKRDAHGLVAAVVQQHDTGEVLMLGWMDDEALRRTLTDGPGDLLVAQPAASTGARATPPATSSTSSSVAPRLRRRRPARAGRPGRRGLPHRRPHLLRRQRPRRRSVAAPREQRRPVG